MGNGYQNPIIPPRPIFATLPQAAKCAVEHGNTIQSINAAKWAETYQCGTEDVREAFERAMTERSLKPSNTCEIPEGK